MGFLKTLFGGAQPDEAEEKKGAEERNFDLLKYDGVKALRIGQAEYAIKCFREALKIKDDDLEVRDYLSRALVGQGLMDEALEQLDAMMKAEPENLGVILQAAHVAYLKEDYDAMTAYCEQALTIDADNAMTHFTYGRAEMAKGNMVQAVARLTKAIAIDERIGDARLLRAQVLMQMGDFQGATDDVEWLLEHTEESEDVTLLHARLERAKGNREKAIEIYGRVTDLNPFQVEAFRERGQVRLELGDKQGAEEDMQTVLELNPQEMADINGEYSAEGIEHKVRQAYSNLNPFGI
ncbi:MAG: tetratricopeptide repeat protein [Prevotella sp.]|nr:tetratricopeptide repeat protein [Prevotella sp.]